MKLFVRFLGFSHVIIALGGGGELGRVFITFKIAGIEVGNDFDNFPIIYFITACTGLGYSVQRLIKARAFPSIMPKDRLDFLERYGANLVLLWSGAWGFSLLNVSGIFTSSVMWMLITLSGAGLSYAILPKFFHGLARSVRGGRGQTSCVEFNLGATTVILPLMMAGDDVSYELICLIFIARVLYIAGLTIPFDVRDLIVDDDEMITLPMMIGVVRSLWFASGLVLVSGLISVPKHVQSYSSRPTYSSFSLPQRSINRIGEVVLQHTS